MQDIIESFRAAMREDGIIYNGVIHADSELHRFHIEGNKAGSLNGAYKLHLDGIPAGFYQDWKSGIANNWKYQGGATRPDAVCAYMKKHYEFDARFRREVKTMAPLIAQKMLMESKPCPANHPYLVRKKIQPHNLRVGSENQILIPLIDATVQLTGLQQIYPDGKKRFIKGTVKKGSFWMLSSEKTSLIFICEGFATAASLYESTGHMVIVAFDAGNLIHVAPIVRGFAPEYEIIIAADNDEVGIKKAQEAAAMSNAKVSIPPEPGTDWNDFYCQMNKGSAA